MRAVIQRAKKASVTVHDEVVGIIDHGLVVLLGVTHDDVEADVMYLATKIVHLRIFEDTKMKMNLSVKDVAGSVLSISQFTLYGDTKKGRRPNLLHAAEPDHAKMLYHQFNQRLLELGVPVQTGKFGEMMNVQFTNVGPVTLILDSKKR